MLPEQQQRIMGYFIEEAKEHLSTIEHGLLNLQSTIDDSEAMNEVFRAAHSVKGGAAMLGLSSIQRTAHRLEDYFKILKDNLLSVDQKLESLFLRAYDALSELVEKLESQSLSDEAANAIMKEVDPTFEELNRHLEVLIQASAGKTLSSSGATTSVQPSKGVASSPMTQEKSALLLTFQSDVPASLKAMLQHFKQSDNATSRQALQDICLSLGRMGEQFDLPTWSNLLEISHQVVSNPDHSYSTLAPVLIKEIKQAQELVLAGRAGEVAPSEVLLNLQPSHADILSLMEVADEPGLLETPQDGLEDFDAFNDLFGAEVDNAEPALTGLDSSEESGLPILEEELDELSAANYPGPEVGIAELNSLADLFEGEVLDLGSAWQETDSFGSALPKAVHVFESIETDSSHDFDDLLFDTNSAEESNFDPAGEEGDEILALFGDSTLIQGDTDTWIQRDVYQDLSFDADPASTLGQSDTDDLNGDALGTDAQDADSDLAVFLSESNFASDDSLGLEEDLGDLDAVFDESSMSEIANFDDRGSGSYAEQVTGTFPFQDGDELSDELFSSEALFGEELVLEPNGNDLDSLLTESDRSSNLLSGSGIVSESSDLEFSEQFWDSDDSSDLLFSETATREDGVVLREDSFEGGNILSASSLEDGASSPDLEIDILETKMASLPEDSLIDFDIADELDFESQVDESLSTEPETQSDHDNNASEAGGLELRADLDLQEDLGLDELDAWMGDQSDDTIASDVAQDSSPHQEPALELSDDLMGLFEGGNADTADNQKLDVADAFDLLATSTEQSPESESSFSFEEDFSDSLADLFEEESSTLSPQNGEIFATENMVVDGTSASSSMTTDTASINDLDLDLFGEEVENQLEFASGSEQIFGEESLIGSDDYGFLLEEQNAQFESSQGEASVDHESLFDQADESFAESLLQITDDDVASSADEADVSLETSTDLDLDWMTTSDAEIFSEDQRSQAPESEDFGDLGDLFGNGASSEPPSVEFEAMSSEDQQSQASESADFDSLGDLGDLFGGDISDASLPTDSEAMSSGEFSSLDMNENELENLNDFLDVPSLDQVSPVEELELDFDSRDFFQDSVDLAGDADFLMNASDDGNALDAFDDLDGMLSNLDAGSLDYEAGASSSEDLDTFGDLDDLLVSNSLSIDDESNSLDDSLGFGDDFAGLDALLDESSSSIDSSSAEQDALLGSGFDDLDALLSDKPAEKPATKSSGSDAGIDADLERLLEDANKLGGVPATKTGRGMMRKASVDPTMRVPIKQLDNLSNLVGELVVNRNSLEQDQERLRQFLDNLLYQVQQLSDVGQRMRDLYERSLLESSLLASRQSYQIGSQLETSAHSTGADFDALEMDRFTAFHSLSQEMIELIVRVRESASDIEFIINEPLDQVTRNFRQVTTQLQEGLTRARMVPFSVTADRLPRGVRDNAIKEGKQAELVVEGRETLIDKMILEQLSDPLTHLVNNAVAHGIEKSDVRQKSNKSVTGRITVRAFHQGNQTVISVSDDGAGINTDRIKRKAIEKGLISPAQAQSMSRSEVYDLLFLPGFSGADVVNDLAGRGVGMDVVRTSLNEIRGSISIDSSLGKGTTFTIRLPLTLSISKALCCISNRARIAFPMDGVEDMLDVPRERVQTNAEGHECIAWRDMLLPFQPLAKVLEYNRFLGRGSVYGGSQEDDIISIVVLRSAGNFTALQVDQVMGEQEIVIKQLQGPVPKPIGIAGATVLGDGRIMPIADVLELIDLSIGRLQPDKTWKSDEAPPTAQEEAPHEPTVLIVDDSITVRELLSMTFSKVGYRVEQARDGQDAWEKLRSGLPCDIVFCDIEMPRMDGLELLSRIQKETSLSHLPIAMLTSRGADRHRQMAIQMGAKGYFTKPYLEEVLLDAAQRMLKGEVLVAAPSGN